MWAFKGLKGHWDDFDVLWLAQLNCGIYASQEYWSDGRKRERYSYPECDRLPLHIENCHMSQQTTGVK